MKALILIPAIVIVAFTVFNLHGYHQFQIACLENDGELITHRIYGGTYCSILIDGKYEITSW